VEEFIAKHSNLTGENGKRVMAKNGFIPQREIVNRILGPLPIKQPGIDNRGLNGYSVEKFKNKILQDNCAECPA
jgi:hypothetical protein